MSELKDKAIREARNYCHYLSLESNLENSIDALIRAGLIVGIESQNKIKVEAYSNVSEILKYEFDGEYSEKGVGDFFDEYADKLKRGDA